MNHQASPTRRRVELGEAATDYVLEHGLIGLSLRPLAAALGTSDRMLLYHFGSKDQLVAAVLRTSTERAVGWVRRLPQSPGVRQAVLDLWQEVTRDESERCHRVYVEAAALGLLGSEPYASVVAAANARWTAALAEHLVASGMAPTSAARAAFLLDAAFTGFQLDLPLESGRPELARAVDDLAQAVLGIDGSAG